MIISYSWKSRGQHIGYIDELENNVELIDIGAPLISNIQTRSAHRMKCAGHAREIKADADTDVHILHHTIVIPRQQSS